MRKYINILLKKKVFNKTDYLLMFLLLQIGVLILLLNIPKLKLLLVPIYLYIYYIRKNRELINDKILIIFSIFLLLAIVQGLIFGHFSVVTIITSFSMMFLLPYLLFKIYRINFFFLFEKVIRLLIYISMIIWLLQQFVPGVKGIIVAVIKLLNTNNVLDIHRFMFFYTYWPALDQDFGLSRNAGFSNEPAAFSVILILAIIINYVKNNKLFNRTNLIYYFALLSTFSTTGYIALSALGLLLLKQKNSKIIGILLFPLFIYGALYAYKNLEFMEDKIEAQYSTAIEKDLNQSTSGRFYGIRKSLFVFSKHPLIGRGLQASTMPDIDDAEFASYGWLSELSRFGILFATLFMFFFLRGLRRFIEFGGFGLYEVAVCTLSIMILLTAQNGITGSIFMVFFFMGLYNYKNSC